MSNSPDLRGVHVPLITPFTDTGELALPALERLAHDVLDAGAAGLVALGTTAEATALDVAERNAVLDICAAVCAERDATLIVGAGGNDTRASVAAVRALAERPEVTAALVVVPYYVRPAEAGVLAHFTAVAEAGPVPVLVYHIPYRTGQALSSATLRALAALPNVVGTKLSVGGIDQDTVEFMADRPADFTVLAGDDLYLLPMLALGGVGGILAAAHLRTADWVALVAAANNGDLATARTLGLDLAGLCGPLFAEPNPAVLMGVLHATGRIPSPALRLPKLPASKAAVAAALATLG